MTNFFALVILFGVATITRTEYTPPLAEKLAQVFTAKFYPEVVKQQQQFGLNPDLVASGFSLLQPLAQLTLSSKGDAHDELLFNVLGLSEDAEVESVAKVYNDLLNSTQNAVQVANKIYVSIHSKLNESYANETRELFGSDSSKIDFRDTENAAKEINDWVKLNTNNKIQNLVDPQTLEANTEVLLLNTIYFKAEWEKKFDKIYTETRDFFYSEEAEPVQKDFLYQKNLYNHGFSYRLNAELLQLNYKTKGFYFNVALPREVKGLPALLKKLEKYEGNLYMENNKFPLDYVKVYLPKFEVTTAIDLVKVLKDLGVKQLFEYNVNNLRNLLLSKAAVKVSQAVQKIFINVEEKGIEAAASDDFQVDSLALNEDPKVFLANHPFYFEVNYYGYTLFSGTVNFDASPKARG